MALAMSTTATARFAARSFDAGVLEKAAQLQSGNALNLAYYHLVKTHGSLRMTPAMAEESSIASGQSETWSMQPRNVDKQTKTVAVLEIPPVHSPQAAVKVAIAAKARQ